MKTPKLQVAEYAGDYKVRLSFEDGATGVVDLESQLWGEVFEPLINIEQFKKFKVDPGLHTIVWPTGADLAPEYLYQQVSRS